MLIPIGHEHTTVRRLPWVSFAIMALNLAVLVALLVSPSASSRASQEALRRAWRYFAERPYLELDPRLREVAERELGREGLQTMLETSRQFGARPPSDRSVRRREQERLRELVDEAFASRERHPFYRWGLVPARIQPHAVITHQFLHAGWIHLLGNMFLFYLCGPFIEDVWGRPLFAAFYLTGGSVAGLMFAIRYSDLNVPLVGASGAVAATMGAFLIRYWRTKIRFFYWFGLVWRGTFEAPAWLMLGLWFVRELFFAQAMDLGGGRSGVAYWAHVWGFAFGAGAAVVVQRLRIEERFVAPAIEEKVTLAANPAIDEAMEAWARGDREAALARIAAAAGAEPGNVDVALAYWNLACQADRATEAGPAMLAAVRAEMRAGERDLAAEHWLELARRLPGEAADPVVTARAVEAFLRAGRIEEAREALDLAAFELPEAPPPGVLTRLTRAAAQVGGVGAVRVLELAAGSPDLPPEVREEAARALAGSAEAAPEGRTAGQRPGEGGGPESETAESGPGETEAAPGVVAPAPLPRKVEAMAAVPVSLGEQELWIEVPGRGRARLRYDRLQAVAVAGIRPPGGKGYLLLDLLLDPPWGDAPTVRAVRVSSRSFDPRRLVPGSAGPLEAFRTVVERILTASQAAPLPSPAAVRGEPFATFPSEAAYEEEVLGVARGGVTGG